MNTKMLTNDYSFIFYHFLSNRYYNNYYYKATIDIDFLLC